jgi:hypothetical protein
MKIAFYMDDGREQIVLTPETDFEKKMLGKLHEGGRQLSVRRGSFYGCRGGWTRWANSYGVNHFDAEDDSTMLVLDHIRPVTLERGGAVGREFPTDDDLREAVTDKEQPE